MSYAKMFEEHGFDDSEYIRATDWFEQEFPFSDRTLVKDEMGNLYVLADEWDFDKDDVQVKRYSLSDYEGWCDEFAEVLQGMAYNI